MKRRLDRFAAFTLIELLIVITIIGVLASMIFPAYQSVIGRSHTVACASNLRQLWSAVRASATDHDNTFPVIKITPDDQPEGEPDAKELKDELSKYGVTDKMLQCPADMAGPKFFNTINTSYRWIPIVEEEDASSVKIYGRRRVTIAKPSRVRVLEDYESVHPPLKLGGKKTINTVYLDGHVRLD